MPDVFKLGGVFLMMVTAITWLLQQIAKTWIDAQFKNVQRESDQRHARQLEEMRHHFTMLQHSETVRFTRLHEKRANAIEDLYKSMLEFRGSVTTCINRANIDDGKGGERFQVMWDSGIILFHKLEEGAIYLDEETCDLVRAAQNSLDQAGLSMTVGSGIPIPDERYYKKLERSRAILDNDFKAALDALLRQFRQILGVPYTSGTSTPELNKTPL